MPDLFRILTLIAALSITAIGAMLGIAGMATSLIGRGPDMLASMTSSTSILFLSICLGAASAWHAARSIQGHRSVDFRPRRVWPLVLLFVVALVLGQTMLSLSLLPALTFPLLHIGATVLPALIILALAGRALGNAATWRNMVLHMASGAFLATPLAMILEAIIILLIASAALLGFAWQPGAEDLLLRLTPYLEDLSWLQEPGRLAAILLTPAFTAVAITVTAGLVPLVEEAVKTIGVALVAYRRPTLPQSFLWGIAAGAGFAAVEGLLNTTGALEAWIPAVLLRIGATLLHCLTGGLMGLAWYQIATSRNWPRGLGLYALSVAIHGLWNGIAMYMVLTSMKALDSGALGYAQGLAGLGTIAMLLLQVFLALCVAGGLAGLTLYVRRRSHVPLSASAQAGPPTFRAAAQVADPEE